MITLLDQLLLMSQADQLDNVLANLTFESSNSVTQMLDVLTTTSR